MPNIKTKKKSSYSKIGETIIKFESEVNDPYPIYETKVIVNNINLCTIDWKEKEKFLYDLNSLINRYKL